MSRFPNALELFSLSALCSSRLRILVSIWGNGSAQGTRLVHGHGPELPPARASLSGSAPCPPALNRLHSRRSDPTFRASAQPSTPSPTPLWGREGGEPRHGYPWVRCDFPPSGGMRAPPVTLLGRRGCEVPVFRSPYTGPRASTSRRAVEGRCTLDPFRFGRSHVRRGQNGGTRRPGFCPRRLGRHCGAAAAWGSGNQGTDFLPRARSVS